jgi:hypothetical protein
MVKAGVVVKEATVDLVATADLVAAKAVLADVPVAPVVLEAALAGTAADRVVVRAAPVVPAVRMKMIAPINSKAIDTPRTSFDLPWLGSNSCQMLQIPK